MSDETLNDAELRNAIRQAARRLQQKSEAERRVLIQQAVEQAMGEEMAEKRAEIEREAAEIRQELTRDSWQEEALRARRTAPSTILLLLLLLLILLLIAAITGRADILGFPASDAPDSPPPTLPARLGGDASTDPRLSVAAAGRGSPGDVAAIGSLNSPPPEISSSFRAHYDRYGGLTVFGYPISPPLQVNGRTIQWFERARLEEWPEHAGTPYGVQGGRVGIEFTRGITFPTQTYFVSRPGGLYFAETGHGVAEPFLSFWERHGGIDVLGYPISDQVQEQLPDGQIYTVQYFERARIERHPQYAGTPFELQLGLLGRALYLNESRPSIIPPPRPTPVPMP